MAEILRQSSLSSEILKLEQLRAERLTTPLSPIEEPVLQAKTLDFQTLKEQACEAGYQSGFNQGLAAGFKEGEEQATQQFASLNLQLKTLLASIPLALAESRLALKADIADLVLLIVQQFFIYQQQNKEAIAQQITAALNQINDKQAITIALNPKDLASLEQGELTIDFSHCPNFRLIADSSLVLGGCLIRSEHGLFDAGIERQIEGLKQCLLQIKEGSNHG